MVNIGTLGKWSWDALGSVTLQVLPCAGSTVRISETPPVANPVASDMERMTFFPAGSVSCVENDPLPLLYAVAGMEMLDGVPNA